MVVVGISISLYIDSITPHGTPGMTETETLELLLKQQENEDMEYFNRNLNWDWIFIGFN